jgi:hypothetical protein
MSKGEEDGSQARGPGDGCPTGGTLRCRSLPPQARLRSFCVDLASEGLGSLPGCFIRRDSPSNRLRVDLGCAQVMVESKEKCKREEKTLSATIEKGMPDNEEIVFKCGRAISTPAPPLSAWCICCAGPCVLTSLARVVSCRAGMSQSRSPGRYRATSSSSSRASRTRCSSARGIRSP